jgi:ubiquitin-protein ligase E3 C
MGGMWIEMRQPLVCVSHWCDASALGALHRAWRDVSHVLRGRWGATRGECALSEMRERWAPFVSHLATHRRNPPPPPTLPPSPPIPSDSRSYGMWQTTAQGELYPHPDSATLLEGGDEAAFEFVGRVLGKALAEGITIGPRFAGFFLHKLLGRPVTLQHLPSLDSELYKSLMFLKGYAGDAEELCLSFVASASLGGSAGEEVELVKGGRDIAVTNRNKMQVRAPWVGRRSDAQHLTSPPPPTHTHTPGQYIQAMADWRLNRSIERQCGAFVRGLRELIPLAWIAPFSAPELQVLISGSQRGIDVDDLRASAVCQLPLFSMDPLVTDFWAVVREMDAKDRAALLRFVTGCERAPPNGFRELTPPFTLHLQSTSREESLPTASTCFNMLHLQRYRSRDVLRAKLLMAIHSGAGFELA